MSGPLSIRPRGAYPLRFEKCPSEDGLPERWVLGDADAGAMATVVPAAGMNLVSLVVDGVDRLALPLPLASFMGTAKTGGVPLLHPWANRLRADRWSFDGRDIDLGHVEGLKRDGNDLPMQSIHTMSGGQKCRLCLALSMYRKPDLLILDGELPLCSVVSPFHPFLILITILCGWMCAMIWDAFLLLGWVDALWLNVC